MRGAIRQTLEVPFEVEGGEIIMPGTGEYTVVALGRTGTVMAAEASTLPDSDGEEAQKRLAAEALQKAIVQLHFSLYGDQVGIQDDENAVRMSELLPERPQTRGAVWIPTGEVKVLTASGCRLCPEYVDGLLPDPEPRSRSGEVFQECADETFAKLTVGNWMFGGEADSWPEPEGLQQLRVAN